MKYDKLKEKVWELEPRKQIIIHDALRDIIRLEIIMKKGKVIFEQSFIQETLKPLTDKIKLLEQENPDTPLQTIEQLKSLFILLEKLIENIGNKNVSFFSSYKTKEYSPELLKAYNGEIDKNEDNFCRKIFLEHLKDSLYVSTLLDIGELLDKEKVITEETVELLKGREAPEQDLRDAIDMIINNPFEFITFDMKEIQKLYAVLFERMEFDKERRVLVFQGEEHLLKVGRPLKLISILFKNKSDIATPTNEAVNEVYEYRGGGSYEKGEKFEKQLAELIKDVNKNIFKKKFNIDKFLHIEKGFVIRKF